MTKYYTRACNFYYGTISKEKIKDKTAIPLNKNNLISFDTIEIITRNYKKKINIKDIESQNLKLKKKIKSDLKLIIKKRKFKKLNFSNLPILMGVVNLTPDSFSDGGKFNKKNKSLQRITKMISAGADIIDVGGESTRPGSKTMNAKIEWKRIHKILKLISKKAPISLDTRKSEVMEKGIKKGVKIINDVSGLNFDSKTINILKKYKIPFVVQHSKGTPKNMQNKPNYKNELLDIYDFFEDKIKFLRSIGIKHKNIIIDPGIGFGKNLKHNMNLISNISIFHSLGFPILVGNSRKRFIKDLTEKNDTKNRIGGTVASSIYLMMQGVQILRIHDVNELLQGVKVFKELFKN